MDRKYGLKGKIDVKIETTRYCRDEGIPQVIYISLMTSFDPYEA